MAGLFGRDRLRRLYDSVVAVDGLDSVAAAFPHSGDDILALKTDGTVWQWRGGNSLPFQVKDLSGIAALAVRAPGWLFGENVFALALAADGQVWEWYGRPPSPFLVGDDIKDIVAVAAGSWHNLALKRDGSVWAWESYLDDWTTISRSNAAPVSGLTAVVAIAAGEMYSLAVKRDGTVWSWGVNVRGQLGDGTTTSRTTPVRVPLLGGITAVSALRAHSLALGSDGTVWSWGGDTDGQLGDGRAVIRTTPVQVIPPGSPDLAVAMSHQRDFAVGTQGVYTLTVTNTGLSATAGTVTVADSLPPGLTYVSGSGTGWTCSAEDQQVSCTSPDPVGPGASMTITLVVNVGLSAVPGVTNLATVSNESDPNIANNSVGDPTVVSPAK